MTIIQSCIVALGAGLLTSGATAADQASSARMVILKGRDISGHVFKRLGLPNQDYCWQQCLSEERCTGARWGVIAGSTAGQCQLFDGEITDQDPHEITTGDGQQIEVTASRKHSG